MLLCQFCSHFVFAFFVCFCLCQFVFRMLHINKILLPVFAVTLEIMLSSISLLFIVFNSVCIIIVHVENLQLQAQNLVN